MPDFISDNKKRKQALEMLKQRVKLLNNSNIACISIACNTAHILLPELQKISIIPFVSMIDEVAKKVYEDGNKKIGILGTPSTIKYRLYQEALNKYGIYTEIPSHEEIIMLEKIIRNVLKGKILKSDTNSLVKIANSLKAKGVEAIILGCTELPLVSPKEYSLPVYNSLKILAMALLLHKSD